MPIKEITDRKGRQYKWDVYDEHGFPAEIMEKIVPAGIEAKLNEVKQLELRDDDIMVCTFPKAGTHWIWEIVSMVTKGAADYETRKKETHMLEFCSSDKLKDLPSQRILNTHFAVSRIPEQVLSKKTKIVHMMRNPKDIAVSYFYHVQNFQWMFSDDRKIKTFSEFLPYATGEYGVYMFVPIFRYYKEMEKFTRDHPDLIINVQFEDMKQNPTAEIEKIARFLDKDLSSEVIQEIADKCSFKQLKQADATLKDKGMPKLETMSVEDIEKKKKAGPTNMYRKGEVGDWKNHFTVAEAEQFDKLLLEEFKDTDIKFTYSIDQ